MARIGPPYAERDFCPGQVRTAPTDLCAVGADTLGAMSRVPLASIAVVAVTAVPSLLQFALPGLEPALMRDPAAIAGGQWWRLVTALVVQDGGLFGTVFNLLTLAALAVLAERTLGPARMLLLYATGAVVGEITGYVLGVAGAGNSITVCALAGVAGLVLAALANIHGLPVLAGMLAGWLVTARRTRAWVA